MPADPIHPAVRVGHVHLQVDDLDLAIAFYRDNLGFNLTADLREIGAAFLAAGDYHHQIGLTGRQSAGASPRGHCTRDSITWRSSIPVAASSARR